MKKPAVFVTRQIPDQGLTLIRPHCQMDIWVGELPPPSEVLYERVRGVAGLICLLSDRIDEAVIQSAGPGLRVISAYSAGVDNIDVAAATRRKIPVGNTPGALTEATADFAFALLMAAARRVTEAERQVRAGQWKTWGPTTLLGMDIHGATLGIIGFGRIGQALARRAAGFNMRVIYFDNYLDTKSLPGNLPAEQMDFISLLSQADFISLHVPLTEETREMVNVEVFDQMKPSAILINTSRGAVVDQAALYQALSTGRIAAAALDVTDPEPLPTDNPLLKLDNLVIAPHIASASHTARERMAVMAAENLLAGLKGEKLPYCVNPQIYT